MNTTVARPIPAALSVRPEVTPVRSRSRSVGFGIIVFFAAHILLAFLIRRFDPVATVHALATVAVGIYWALTNPRRMERVAYMGAYIMGSEVLWRMARADVFWEMGKYSVAAVFIVAMLRSGRLKGPAIALAYFVLLLPSIVLTMQYVEPSIARGWISATLSGPFALMVSAWFFSNLKLPPGQLQRLFLYAIGPIIGIASVALFGTLELSEIRFTNQSNEATSGGFGPNQVSSALGLGALLAFHALTNGKVKYWIKIFILGAMVFLAAQSAMTFSRGGLYTATGAALAASLFMLKDGRSRAGVLVLAALIYVIGAYFVFPSLNEFTGGALSARFSDTTATNRDEIIWADLEIWKENPILGVGPGTAKYTRAIYLDKPASPHTEFSRMVAEHGLFGCAALVLLLIMAAQTYFRARTVKGKALVSSFLVWSFLYMFVNAMRLVAPAFLFGVCFATIVPEDHAPGGPRDRRRVEPRANPAVGHRRAKINRPGLGTVVSSKPSRY